MTIDWSKAPEGAQWHTRSTWYKAEGSLLMYWCGFQSTWRKSKHASIRDVGFYNTVTPRPSEPKPYTRDEALQFLVERLDSWPTDIADAPLCPGWGWESEEGESWFAENQSPYGMITHDSWNTTRPDFVPFVSVEDAQPATAKQPAPSGKGDPILGMVLADLTNRALEGREKYGEALKANNGRNALWDAYQEALDLAMYLRQAIEEQHRAQTDR